MTEQEARDDGAYCESCEADRLWETDRIQPVWASPTHTCGEAQDDGRAALYDGAWQAISGRHEPWGGCAEREKVERVAAFAAGYRERPEPAVTDEMVERALVAAQAAGPLVPIRARLAVALEAALRVPVGEGDVSR